MQVCLHGLCLLMLLGASVAQAQEDPRFHITLNFEKGVAPALPEQVKQALPTLWDRVLTQQARGSIPKNIKAMPLLLRIQPQQDGSIIEFNASRVWARLEQDHISHIRKMPTFNLQLTMLNAFGSRMTSSESDLQAYAQQQSKILGIGLQTTAPLLAIRIQWLDDRQVQVSVQGQSRLEEFSKSLRLEAENPFLQIEKWLVNTLIQARDAYQWKAKAVIEVNDTNAQESIPSLQLFIQHDATLSEQIALETALQDDSRVQSVTPAYLNHASQVYRIQLKQADDSWLMDWFAKRGMHASMNEQGWLIQ